MDQYVVFDLEMCTVPPGKRTHFAYHQEMIQIGAVILDGEYIIQDQFVSLVHPEFGYIGGYIRNMTGISAQMVKHSPTASEVIPKFFQWIPDGAILVTWSDSDIIQLRTECREKNIDVGNRIQVLDRWIDCQKMFGERVNVSYRSRLTDAIAMVCAGEEYDTRAHDALVDAKNTAIIFSKLQMDEITNWGSYLIREEDYKAGNY